MSPSHDPYLDLVAALAVGALGPEDRRVLAEHLPTCPECQAFLRDLSAPVESLARSAEPARPRPGLKARVMVEIANASAARRAPAPRAAPAPVRPLVPTWAWGVAAALVLATGVAWWRANELASRVDGLERQLAATGVDPDAELVRFSARHPSARTLDLKATPAGEPGRTARAAYDASSRRAVVVFEGFRAPPGEDFELWTVRGGKTVSEGLVRVDENGRGVRIIENTGDPAELEAFAVSREAAGGAPDRATPKTVVYLAPAK